MFFFLISAFSSHLPATTGLFSPQPPGNYSLVPSVSTLDRVGIVWGLSAEELMLLNCAVGEDS